MANHSDGRIKMECAGCLNEMMFLIESINANKDALFRLVEPGYTVEKTEGYNSGIIKGQATGRWGYRHNVEGYLERLGDNKHPEWVLTPIKGLFQSDDDYTKTKLYYKRQQRAYDLLRAACSDDGGVVNINWTDLEMVAGVFENHQAEFSDGNYTETGWEELELTPENLVKYNYADDLDEARDWLGVDE